MSAGAKKQWIDDDVDLDALEMEVGVGGCVGRGVGVRCECKV